MTDVTRILSAIESGDRLSGSQWVSRGHFFAATAEPMRRILIDRARAHGAKERGGSWRRVDLELT